MKTQSQRKYMSLSETVFLIVLSSASLGLVSCEREGSAEKAGRKIDQAAESAGKKLESARESLGGQADRAGEYMDDSAITAKVKAEILADPLLKVSDVSVSTSNGVVTLTGVVDSQHSLDRALELARSKANVKSVENRLVIKVPERP